MEGLAARLETSMGFGSASDAAAKLERVEADLARRRAELATAQTALDALRARRDTAAMRVADLHRAEREGDRELKASESAAADLREKLRKQRQRQDEEASRALEAEGRLQAMRSNRAAFNDDEDESAIRARHTRNVETFAARRDKANCELAALRHENEHLITQTQQLIAQRQAAQLQLRTSSLETVSPSPPASPTPLEVHGRSGPPTPLNSGNDSRIVALRKEIEKITAAMEQLTLEAKRLKDLRAAPAWMSLNVSVCSLAQLKAMQAELRKAMGEGEGHVKQLRLDVAAAKAAADERKRETDSRRPAVPRDAKSDWQLKALQEALERRDTRLGDLKMQVARIKQLEAKLAVAGDTMIDLTAAAEVRHQQSVSKAKSDQAWASARNAATRRTSTNGLQSESSFGTSKSGSHF
jgi:chromosome segregation ATPase